MRIGCDTALDIDQFGAQLLGYLAGPTGSNGETAILAMVYYMARLENKGITRM